MVARCDITDKKQGVSGMKEGNLVRGSDIISRGNIRSCAVMCSFIESQESGKIRVEVPRDIFLSSQKISLV